MMTIMVNNMEILKDIQKEEYAQKKEYANEEEQQSSTKKYTMNEAKALEVIMKNTKVSDFKREDKSTCTILRFSSGAYQQVVMVAVDSFKEKKRSQIQWNKSDLQEK